MSKIGTIFEINNRDSWNDSSTFGFDGKFDKSVFALSEMIIDDIGGSSAENTREVEGFGNEAGET